MKNAQMLLKEGNGLLAWSRFLGKLFCFGLVFMMITMLFCGEYATRYLALSGAYHIVNIMVFALYICIGLGSLFLPFYFFGMIFIGLGQIAENTAPNQDADFETAPQPVPTPQAAPLKTTNVSPALLNSLHAALNEPFDTELVKRLEEAKLQLTNPQEKQLIQRILDAPSEQVARTVAQRVYAKLSKKQDS